MSDDEVAQLVGRLGQESFHSHDEQEVAGYAYVMESIQTAWSDLQISGSILLQFHRDLLRYSNKEAYCLARRRTQTSFREQDIKAALVDADVQSSLSIWAKQIDPSTPVDRLQSSDESLDEVKLISEKVIIIDVPAGLGEVTRSILLDADLALIPCGPSALDLRAASVIFDLFKNLFRALGGNEDEAILHDGCTERAGGRDRLSVAPSTLLSQGTGKQVGPNPLLGLTLNRGVSKAPRNRTLLPTHRHRNMGHPPSTRKRASQMGTTINPSTLDHRRPPGPKETPRPRLTSRNRKSRPFLWTSEIRSEKTLYRMRYRQAPPRPH